MVQSVEAWWKSQDVYQIIIVDGLFTFPKGIQNILECINAWPGISIHCGVLNLLLSRTTCVLNGWNKQGSTKPSLHFAGVVAAQHKVRAKQVTGHLSPGNYRSHHLQTDRLLTSDRCYGMTSNVVCLGGNRDPFLYMSGIDMSHWRTIHH